MELGSEAVAEAGPVVTFPDPAVVAQIAALEAPPQLAPVAFRWFVSIASALVGALLGGALYAGITYATDHQYGIVAIAIGLLAGLGAARGGRCRQAQIVGACAGAIGYFAAIVMALYAIVGPKLFDLTGDQLWLLAKLLAKDTFTTMNALFLAIAVFNGWKIPRARS